MELANAPSQLVVPWANAGSKNNPIPIPSQIGITPGAASWTDGWPPLCDTPLSEGGIWPSMQDANGGLYQMSAVDVWMCAGGGFPYNSAFSASIGGYPKGARVLMASGNGYWVSTVDNNVTDPDTGGSGWASADENAITALTGDVTATGPGSATATLAASGVTAGSYIGANITVDAKGRVTAAANGAFPFTGTSGYQKLPSGLILQWGSFSTNGQAITFPLTFPNALFIITTTLAYPDGSGDSNWSNYSSAGVSGFTVNIGGAHNGSGNWFAIGY